MSDAIDWEQLDMIADGFTEDFVEIYQEFLLDLPETLSKLEAALAQGDAYTVSRAAHQAKGSAANFGFAGFSAIMASIEHKAKAGTVEGLAAEAATARTAFAAAVDAVKSQRGI